MRRILVLLTLVMLCACGPPLSSPMPTHTPTTVTGPGAPALTPADISAISTPTSQPTEFVPTLETLDRVFEDTDDTRAAREALVTRHIAPLITDARVVAASRAVPRHSFVPTSQFASAYIDYALPIGYGQTISQPSLVAMMTEYLDLQAGERVLEIGTGSGYQAAMLRELTDAVYSVEIIPELASTARTVLDRMGYADIHLDRRDGYFGWAEHAPYDAIIVTAAPDHLPAPLVAQLNPDGGRMVIPIGPVGNVQTLWLVTRSGDDAEMERLLEVRFVPFTRE